MTIDKRLREHGYHILLSCYDSNHGLERDYLSYMLTTGVDGLIYIPEDLSADEFYELTAQRSIPVVQVDRSVQGVQTDAVLTDNIDAVHRVMSHLIEKGHRRIAIITGPKSVFTAKERLVGYLRALSDHDISYDDTMVVNGELTFATGYQSFIKLMSTSNPPTAIFCTNHDITMGCITAARERNYQLPDQIDIFGYDSLESCSIMAPPIPVVHQPEDEIARVAAAYLVDRLNGYDGPIRQTRLKSRLAL